MRGMGCGHVHLSTWVTQELKQRFVAIAQHEGLTESALLRRMIMLSLTSTVIAVPAPDETKALGGSRISVRLSQEDIAAVQRRGSARGMPAATYVSALVRAHLRSLTPLPRAERAALQACVTELTRVGTNLNTLAQKAHQTRGSEGPGREELVAVVKVCTALRDHVRALIRANVASWEAGHAPASHR